MFIKEKGKPQRKARRKIIYDLKTQNLLIFWCLIFTELCILYTWILNIVLYIFLNILEVILYLEFFYSEQRII